MDRLRYYSVSDGDLVNDRVVVVVVVVLVTAIPDHQQVLEDNNRNKAYFLSNT